MLNQNQQASKKILMAAAVQVAELLEELEMKGLPTRDLEIQLRNLGVRLMNLMEEEK